MSTARLIVEKHYLKVVESNFGPNRSNSKIVHQKTIIYLGIKTLTWVDIVFEVIDCGWVYNPYG